MDYEELLQENRKLREENAKLRRFLSKRSLIYKHLSESLEHSADQARAISKALSVLMEDL